MTTAGLLDTIVVEETADYRHTGQDIAITFPVGGIAAFTLAQNGSSLSTRDAGCYPGQRSAIVDIAFPLVYEK